MSTITLPDMIGWNARQPTVEECELVGRDVFYAEPLKGSGIGDCGGYVIETSANPDAQAKLTEAFELFGMCDPRTSSRQASTSRSDWPEPGFGAMIGMCVYGTHTLRCRCKDALGPPAGAHIAASEGRSAGRSHDV
jgi:hypothetical protein